MHAESIHMLRITKCDELFRLMEEHANSGGKDAPDYLAKRDAMMNHPKTCPLCRAVNLTIRLSDPDGNDL